MLNTLSHQLSSSQFPQQEATRCEHPFSGNPLIPRSQEGSHPQDHSPILTTSRSAANKRENLHLSRCAEVTQTSKHEMCFCCSATAMVSQDSYHFPSLFLPPEWELSCQGRAHLLRTVGTNLAFPTQSPSVLCLTTPEQQ